MGFGVNHTHQYDRFLASFLRRPTPAATWSILTVSRGRRAHDERRRRLGRRAQHGSPRRRPAVRTAARRPGQPRVPHPRTRPDRDGLPRPVGPQRHHRRARPRAGAARDRVRGPWRRPRRLAEVGWAHVGSLGSGRACSPRPGRDGARVRRAGVNADDSALLGGYAMPWQIDPMHTQVEFAVKHFGMMTVRGRFNDVKASGSVDPDEPEESRFGVVIDVASLNTHNAQRDDDLRGSYFLELDKYPTITFKGTAVERLGGDRYALTGDLTIKGITRPVTLEVQRLGEVSHEQMGHRIAYTAEGQIMRRDFGMAFDMLADNRLVVGQEGKITVDGELGGIAGAGGR